MSTPDEQLRTPSGPQKQPVALPSACANASAEVARVLSHAAPTPTGESDEALAVGREAVAALPAENAQLVANAAVGCAVERAGESGGVARAREAMALRRACGAPPMAGAQARALR